ncbi:MAG: lipopolysaccharide biosynthesis protein [Marmoricola sp.]
MTTTLARSGTATLSRRASLNALAAVVDYGARIAIQLALAPLMLRFLGPGGFGAWQVLQRLVGHATPAGGRPGEALKWVVAQGQGSDDLDGKRAQVGTAVQVWALFAPLVLVFGGVLAWISPALVHVSGGGAWEVRAAAGLLVVNLVLLSLAVLPQSVLQGENLGYRRLGLSTSILFVGALLMALTLWLGWGLRGLALATIVGTALSGLTYLQIVRRQVPWWGIARPLRGTVRGFIGLSWWFLLWNLVMQAMKGSDLIVLGAVAGTTAVATYSLTSTVPQAVSDTVFMVVSATMPGLGGLVGSGALGRAAKVRAETLALCWLVAVSSGATVIVWLPSFLRLWVGSRYDAGGTATVLICVMVLQLALIRVDSNVIDVTLRVRAKVTLGLLSAGLAVGLGVLAAGPAHLGIAGLVAAFVLGRLPLTVAYPVLIARLLQLPRAITLRAVWRPGLVSAGLFAAAVWLRPHAGTVGWIPLVALGLVTGVLFLALAYVTGLTASQRHRIRTRARRVAGRG